MARKVISLVALLAWLGISERLASRPALGDEDARQAIRFVQGLRDRGYYELAADYLEQVRKQEDAPPELVLTAEYELGRLLLDEAAKTGDLVRRRDLLDQARGKLETFTRSNADHKKAPDALVELARLLVERGHLAMLQVDELEGKAEKAEKLNEARLSFDQARTAYGTAETRLNSNFSKYPKFIPDGDPRKEEKERYHTSLMQARLQKAVVDYEQGQTFPADAKERKDLMTKALAQFEDLYKRYRLNMAGLTARMMQGKCFEEQGEFGKAMGIYNELMEHADPRLRSLQRYVGYYKIIVLGKRKEYALGADEALRWLQANNSNEAMRSKEGLGVQLELAKNILLQLKDASNSGEKAAAIKRATDVLGNLVRYSSPYKAEAIELLKKYKPRAAMIANDVAKLNYDEALSQGEQALAAHEWDRATSLLKQAIRRAEGNRDVDKVNYARYNLAFGYYQNKRYYEAVVLCDQLSRRYPRGGLSPKAAELGIASFAEAYNSETQIDRAADLNNLIDLAKYTAETYPELEQGDTARLTLGQIYHGMGKYDRAIESFGSIRPKSSRWLEAQTRSGASHWEQSQSLRRAGKAAEADAEVEKALGVLQIALKSRQDAAAAPTDPALIANACDIADINLEIGKPDVALKLLDPLAKLQTTTTGPAYSRLIATLLRCHIATNQVELAIADMGTLEKAGASGANLTQLYYRLGKLLEKEIDTLKKKGDSAGLNRTQSAYLKFLSALASSKTGQTFESLLWVGENMLTLGNPKEAEAVLRQVLKTYENDPKFLALPGSSDKILKTHLKLAATLRAEKNYGEAESLVSQLIEANPRTIEPMMEKGLLLEDLATAKRSPWGKAFAYWQNLALRLGKARAKPPEYYEAWYHAALALQHDNKSKEAKQTLASVMRLSATVGGPQMKEKYKTLIDQLK
ncbi:MAG: hypothetical protein NVSMB9_13060 [Isosphaeraceae bacterium]